MSLGNFMTGVTQGVPTGQRLRGLWDERALTRELSALDQRKREAITPEPGEDGAPGESYYELGGKRYFTSEAPPDYLWEADKLKRQSELYRKRGFQHEAMIAEEKASELAKTGQAEHYEALAQRARPLFYDDTGRARTMAEIMANPEQVSQLTGIMNDPAFDDVRNVGGNYIRVRGMTPLDGERAALDLDVIDPQTGRVIRQGPATEGRSSDPNDLVAALTPEQLFSGMQSHLRGNSPTYAKLDDASRAVAGREGMIRDVLGGGLGAAGSAPSAGGPAPRAARVSGSVAQRYRSFAPSIEASAAKHGVPAPVLAGLLAQESGFDHGAVGDNDNSWGMGQFNRKGAAADFGLTRAQILALSPQEQIDLTANFLAQKIAQEKGDVWRGVRRYNGGGDPNYVRNVQSQMAGLNLALDMGAVEPAAPSPTPAAPSAAPAAGDIAAYAARYPNEVSLSDAERFGRTGSLSEPYIKDDGMGGQVAMDRNTGRELWTRAGTPQPEDVEVIRHPKGGATAVGKRSGKTAWEVGAPEVEETEMDRLKLQKARRESVEDEGQLVMGDAWTPEHSAKTLVTMDALGIPYGVDKIGPLISKAAAITKAVEDKNASSINPFKPHRWLNSDVKFDSYTLGISAIGMGLRETDVDAVQEKLVEPMQAISGGKGLSADEQAHAFRTLAVTQGKGRMTTQEATEATIVARKYNLDPLTLGYLIDKMGEKKTKMSPGLLDEMMIKMTPEERAIADSEARAAAEARR